MGLLDSDHEEPKSKLMRWIISGVALVVLVAIGLYFAFRYEPEKRAVEHFLSEVVAGDLQQAYQIWHPQPKYPFSRFVSDWGPDGYYGPIASYHVESATEPEHGGSGIIVTVELSPYSPYPDASDPKSSRTREVQIWVEVSDKSLSFPP
ncbi:MAG: hypothetical protein ABSA32_02075 [Candidatus Acidiferrales bacterium]|jgi:hypothetical protein